MLLLHCTICHGHPNCPVCDDYEDEQTAAERREEIAEEMYEEYKIRRSK